MTKFLQLAAAAVFSLFIFSVEAQNTDTAKLNLGVSVIDAPQNFQLPYTYPSMRQSVEMANNFYDVSFWGLDALGDLLINPHKSTTHKIGNAATNYLLGLAFANYGSELPIPLGVWAHEEFHRTVLGLEGINSKNGNWILHRWDGTVYGPEDAQLADLKTKNLQALLYSYTSGIQSENMITRTNVLNDFYQPRSFYKNPLYLYNAYYVWNYFSFSTSAASDSVKKIAPEFEPKQAHERDFAGADLTAWAYDMFNPTKSYYSRDSFPNGDGVNRRVGFHTDLSTEAQDYLQKQKTLSLINFLNPAIFMLNRIHVSDNFSFNIFAQYAPTHFGNAISVVAPFKLKQHNYLLGLHNYNSYNGSFAGLEAGIINKKFSEESKLSYTGILNAWMQPKNQDFYASKADFGGAAELGVNYRLSKHFSANAYMEAKTKGWKMGNPYLNENISFRAGLNYIAWK